MFFRKFLKIAAQLINICLAEVCHKEPLEGIKSAAGAVYARLGKEKQEEHYHSPTIVLQWATGMHICEHTARHRLHDAGLRMIL